LRLLKVELLDRQVLRKISLRSDIQTAAHHRVGINIVNIIAVHPLHEHIRRKAIQHRLALELSNEDRLEWLNKLRDREPELAAKLAELLEARAQTGFSEFLWRGVLLMGLEIHYRSIAAADQYAHTFTWGGHIAARG
jgi:hypothetical protein